MIHIIHFKIALKFGFKKNKNRFLSFISFACIAGVAIGVMALITVLSVMNGFQEELRNRILDMVSHIEIRSEQSFNNWQQIRQKALQNPQVLAASGILESQNMLINPKAGTNAPAVIQAIIPNQEQALGNLDKKIIAGTLDSLKANQYQIILGHSLARKLKVNLGEKIQVLTSQVSASPMGFIPRSRYFSVGAIFEFGMDDFDSNFAFIHLADGQKLYRLNNQINQIKLKVNDIFKAQQIAQALKNNELKQFNNLIYLDWSKKYANFFTALKIEKKMMFLVLSLIIAVAAFNTISSMVMSVNDRLKNIAILRTIGMNKQDILWIFASQGILIGLIGLILGNLLGITISLNLDHIIPFIENLFTIRFFPADVYYISQIPSNLQINDVIFVNLVSLSLSFLATLYPCWYAAKVNPIDHLKYE